MEIIRKYSNRKMYSKTTNRYLSLDDILFRVQQNMKFQVLDETDQDVTKKTLGTLFWEHCKHGIDSLPEEILRDMIVGLKSFKSVLGKPVKKERKRMNLSEKERARRREQGQKLAELRRQKYLANRFKPREHDHNRDSVKIA